MKIYTRFESPLCHVISFEKIIKYWKNHILINPDDNFAKDLVNKSQQIPELENGFNDYSIIHKNKELISDLLSCIFPKLLTHTDISAATFPWSNQYFNPTEKFKKLIEESDTDFYINNDNFDADYLYIVSCSFILNRHYNIPTSSYFPLFYNFTNKNGINKHYRVIYNDEFLSVEPTDQSINLTKEQINTLLDNPNDIDLWKQFFPPQSWIIKGFGIMSLFDVTIETAFSNLKQEISSVLFLAGDKISPSNENLKSIFNVNSIHVGISNYDFSQKKFKLDFYNMITHSLILNNQYLKQYGLTITHSIFKEYIKNNEPLIISNLSNFLKKYPKDEIISILYESGFNSCALIPLRKGNTFLGIAELTSEIPSAFNSLTSYRINTIYSFIADHLEKGMNDFSNLKNSIIQKEYTSLHPSVAWKFEREVEFYLKNQDKNFNFREIVFKDVIALYGDIDISNSSKTQNKCIKKDIKTQVNLLEGVLDYLYKKNQFESILEVKNELILKYKSIKKSFKANSESEIQQFIINTVNPLLIDPDIYQGEKGIVADYLKSLDPINGRYYDKRKEFDNSVNKINQQLVSLIDNRQKEIQKEYPHYFERFKTDGIEHTIYLGKSITPPVEFTERHLNQLRIWQLLVTCEMLAKHYEIYDKLEIPLDLTSLILVFNREISIRFRMDEKRFDVDGSYNTQYEVLKKRIDKSHVKGTKERITQKRKISIVYSHSSEEKEYLKYIQALIKKGFIKDNIEILEVENLQDLTGLKAIRVEVNLDKINQSTFFSQKYNYDEFIDFLN